MTNRVVGEQYTGFTAIPVGTNAVSPFTGQNNAVLAQLTFESSALRYRLDGASPTSGSGHLVSNGDTLKIEGNVAIQGFRVICPTVTGYIMASLGFL